MRRLLAVVAATALVASLASSSVAAEPASGISRAYGHFLVGLNGQAVGWVTVDVREPTTANPDPGVFTFQALPGTTADLPISTRAAIYYVDFYRELNCCGNPASLVIGGVEVDYRVNENGPYGDWYHFSAGFYDLGSARASGDFFRWGMNVDGEPQWNEYYVVAGSFTVELDANE